jgi:hypothetical protein
MKEFFVTLEVAKVLFTKGYNEKCMAFYNAHGRLVRYHNGDLDPHRLDNQVLKPSNIKLPDTYVAPLWEQAVKWFNLNPDENINYHAFMTLTTEEKERKLLMYLN